jgi:hypothetical protein
MTLAGSNATRHAPRAEDRPAQTTFLAPAPHAPRLERGPAPSFSVIVAAYQAADVIGEALASARQQTLGPLEVIVCDDGSTDQLEAAVAPYREQIVLIRKENGGEASAKNAAARVAEGDFIVILDADDIYLPSRLARLSELAQARPDLDILTTNGTLIAGGRQVRNVYDRSWRFETDEQRTSILQRNFIFGLAAVRRTRFEEHGGFDESILWTTDWDLWLRMILAGSSAGCVDEPLALYRLREQSLTAKRRDLQLGKLATLRKARTNPHLRAEERPVLERSIAAAERGLALLDLQAAVSRNAPDVRTRALDVLRGRDYAPRVRLAAAAAALAPRLSGHIVRLRESSSWVGAGGIRVSRATRV